MGRTYQLIAIGINNERKIIDISESESEFKGMKIVTLKKLLITRLPSLTGLAGIDYLRLLFSNQELENEKTLSDYGINDRSTICTVCKLLGAGLEMEI